MCCEMNQCENLGVTSIGNNRQEGVRFTLTCSVFFSTMTFIDVKDSADIAIIVNTSHFVAKEFIYTFAG